MRLAHDAMRGEDGQTFAAGVDEGHHGETRGALSGSISPSSLRCSLRKFRAVS